MTKEYTFDISKDNPHHLANKIYSDLQPNFLKEKEYVLLKSIESLLTASEGVSEHSSICSSGYLISSRIMLELKMYEIRAIKSALENNKVEINIIGWESFGAALSNIRFLTQTYSQPSYGLCIDHIVKHIRDKFTHDFGLRKFGLTNDDYERQPQERKHEVGNTIETLKTIFKDLALKPNDMETIAKLEHFCNIKPQTATVQQTQFASQSETKTIAKRLTACFAKVATKFQTTASKQQTKEIPSSYAKKISLSCWHPFTARSRQLQNESTCTSNSYQAYDQVDVDISVVSDDTASAMPTIGLNCH